MGRHRNSLVGLVLWLIVELGLILGLAPPSAQSIERWVDAGLGLDDYVHFTDEGYRQVGTELHRAITEDFTPSP